MASYMVTSTDSSSADTLVNALEQQTDTFSDVLQYDLWQRGSVMAWNMVAASLSIESNTDRGENTSTAQREREREIYIYTYIYTQNKHGCHRGFAARGVNSHYWRQYQLCLHKDLEVAATPTLIEQYPSQVHSLALQSQGHQGSCISISIGTTTPCE